MDLAPQVLEAFILLMIVSLSVVCWLSVGREFIFIFFNLIYFLFFFKAQARECLFEKLLLSYRGDSAPAQDIDAYLEQAQEAAEVNMNVHYRVYFDFGVSAKFEIRNEQTAVRLHGLINMEANQKEFLTLRRHTNVELLLSFYI